MPRSDDGGGYAKDFRYVGCYAAQRIACHWGTRERVYCSTFSGKFLWIL
jgi:hypothetical protein